jgi:hypothetical protein
MSESVIPSYTTATESAQSRMSSTRGLARSTSISESSRGSVIPDRPARPRYGLFDSPRSRRTAIFSPSTTDTSEPIETARDPPRYETSAQETLSRNDSTGSNLAHAFLEIAADTGSIAGVSPASVPSTQLRPRTGSASTRTKVECSIKLKRTFRDWHGITT